MTVLRRFCFQEEIFLDSELMLISSTQWERSHMKLIDDILFIKLVEFAKYNFVKSSKNKFVNIIYCIMGT